MRRASWTLILFAIVTLAACGSPTTATHTPTVAVASAAASQPSTAATPVTPTVAKEPTSTAVAPASASPSPVSRQCMFRMTGYLRNRDLTAKLQAALVAASFPNATAEVSDAGEDYACNDNTSSFGLMNRDLSITLPVTNMADRDALGMQLVRIVTTASQYATAPSENRYLVTFTAGGSKEQVIATKTAWQQTQQKGLTGAALLDALQAQSR